MGVSERYSDGTVRATDTQNTRCAENMKRLAGDGQTRADKAGHRHGGRGNEQ